MHSLIMKPISQVERRFDVGNGSILDRHVLLIADSSLLWWLMITVIVFSNLALTSTEKGFTDKKSITLLKAGVCVFHLDTV